MFGWIKDFGRSRWWRWPVVLLGAYVMLTVVVNIALLGSVLVGRATGHDERVDVAGLQIKNFRQVDERLSAGAQPVGDAYEQLAATGVTTVVDLRTGATGDPILDDPERLAELGIEYVSIPIRDGHAPDSSQIDAFLAVMENSTGGVYLHCGGGVGRSTSVEMAYRAANGLDHDVLTQVAIGPPTLEQAYFGSELSADDQSGVNGPIVAVSRAVDTPRSLITWIRGTLTNRG